MKKNEKQFVTRQRYYGFSRVWGIWDKVTCDWYNEGYFGREDALRVADKLNRGKVEKYEINLDEKFSKKC